MNATETRKSETCLDFTPVSLAQPGVPSPNQAMRLSLGMVGLRFFCLGGVRCRHFSTFHRCLLFLLMGWGETCCASRISTAYLVIRL